jgi:hypothetical protein
MARESQGLQIALIIFVMLAVVLGVTTFLCFRKYDEESIKAKSSDNNLVEEQKKCAGLEAERNELKRIIGAAQNATLDDVKKQSEDDMTDFPAESRFYSPVVKQLLASRVADAATLKKEQLLRAKAEADLAVREARGKDQYDGMQTTYDTANKRRDADIVLVKTDRDRIVAEQAENLKVLEKIRKDKDNEVARMVSRRDDLQKQVDKLAQLNADQVKVIRSTRPKEHASDSFNGEITTVSQHTKTVWINLGAADALERQVTFGVYPGDATKIDKSAMKGTIEIVSVDGQHMARARVVDDKGSNPIMKGDKIYNVAWSPEPRHFALTGFLDLDNDGKSDLKTVINLIQANGGVVDAYMDEKGKQIGEMTINTRFLVVGKAPNVQAEKPDVRAKGDPNVDTFSTMQADAEKYGATKMTLAELKEKVGYRSQGTAQRLGSPPPPGQNRNTGDVFAPRKPPAGGGGAPAKTPPAKAAPAKAAPANAGL